MSNSNNLIKNLGQNIHYRKSKSPDIHEKSHKKTLDGNKKISVAEEMNMMKQRREDRKRRIEEEKQHKKDLMNDPNYISKMDYDFDYLIKEKKKIIESKSPEPHSTSEDAKIYVCVRKRPIFEKELQNGEIDCISAINPKVCIYDCKLKIDGYTKYIDNNEFYFDNVFNDDEDTEILFDCAVRPSLDLLLKGGVITCFAYGQTGSGKTYTMKGIQNSAIDTIFAEFGEMSRRTGKTFHFFVSFFEIYSGRLYDLLNNRNKLMALEDKNQKVQIYGLTEKEVASPSEMQDIVEYANTVRTTHNTVTNETSSRSHAICNFVVKIEKKMDMEEFAKLTLVDLAGSERATETQSNNKSRLAEGAEINKSLLALKECIRALDVRKVKGNNDQHVPFRNSKLTLVLRDSFITKSDVCKIIMISCISPSNHSSNHTINTLRYSDRLKEKTIAHVNNQRKQPNKQQAQYSVNTEKKEINYSNNMNYIPQSNANYSNQTNKNNKISYKESHGKTPNLVKNSNEKFTKIAMNLGNKDISMGKIVNTNSNSNVKNINISFKGRKRDSSADKKINNFFDDAEDLDEDETQKLNMKPSILEQQPKKRAFVPKKKNNKYEKKSKTTRVENEGSGNEKNERNIKPKIFHPQIEEDFNEDNVNYNDESQDFGKKLDGTEEDLANLEEPHEEKMHLYVNKYNNNDKNIENKEKNKEESNANDKKSLENINENKDNDNHCCDDKTNENNIDYNNDKEKENIDSNKSFGVDNSGKSKEEKQKHVFKKKSRIINNGNKEVKSEDLISTENPSYVANQLPKETKSEGKEEENLIPDILEEQDFLISSHMNIIKSEAKLLTEEGNLISKIKGISEESYSMEEYAPKIEDIISKKLKYFKELKEKIKNYKALIN